MVSDSFWNIAGIFFFFLIRASLNIFLFCYISLIKEHTEAKNKLADNSVESDKKTFLKAQLPKLEAEIKEKKTFLASLLEEEELDPRGEWYILAQKITK